MNTYTLTPSEHRTVREALGTASPEFHAALGQLNALVTSGLRDTPEVSDAAALAAKLAPSALFELISAKVLPTFSMPPADARFAASKIVAAIAGVALVALGGNAEDAERVAEVAADTLAVTPIASVH